MSATQSAIEQEVAKYATFVGPKKKEGRQKYLERVVRAGAGVDDDTWKKMTEPTQNWLNAGSKALQDNSEIPEPDADGEEPEAEAATAEESTEEVVEEAPAPKKNSKSGGKKAAGAPAEEAPPPKKGAAAADKKSKTRGRSGGGNSMSRDLKIMFVKKPTLSTDQLMEKLTAKGHTPSKLSVSTIRADTRHTLSILAELGLCSVSLDE